MKFRSPFGFVGLGCLILGFAFTCFVGCSDELSQSAEKLDGAETKVIRDVRTMGSVDELECDVFKVVVETAEDSGALSARDSVRWTCRLDASDAGGLPEMYLPLEGLDPSIISAHQKSMDAGTARFRISGADVSKHAIAIATGTKVEVLNRPFDDGARRGTLAPRPRGPVDPADVLVVRIIAPDGVTSQSTAELSRRVFGGFDDELNLAMQYDACSYGQKQFAMATGNTIVDGVIEVTIDENVVGNSHYNIINAANVQIAAAVGPPDQFDHVMYCVPEGANSMGAAWAQVNGYVSGYNDPNCQSASVAMHEVGHNLGLAHSGGYGLPYSDVSGYMGKASGNSETPKKCFNAAKSAKLGWYSDRESTFDHTQGTSWSGKVIGVVDYGVSKNDHTVVLRIPQPNTGDVTYFLHYNVQEGINEGPTFLGDLVNIVERDADLTKYANSTLVESLTAGESHTIWNFDGTGRGLSISVASLGVESSQGTDVQLANVQIVSDIACTSNEQCDDDAWCNGTETCQGGYCILGTPCNDGIFCNGIEVCDEELDTCSPGPDPCDLTPPACHDPYTCDESSDTCFEGATVPDCCGNHACEAGEDCTSCAADCIQGSYPDAVCGNGVCEDGEDCFNCDADCAGKTKGRKWVRYCCVGGPSDRAGAVQYGVNCFKGECGSSPFSCSFQPRGYDYCCGDNTCHAPDETSTTCSVDCM